MTGKFTNQLQAAILFEGGHAVNIARLADFVVQAFTDIGLPMRVAQAHGEFAVILGAHDLHVTLEFVPNRADEAALAGALGSAFVQRLAPDAAERVARHTSLLIIEVRHGVMPDLPELAAFQSKIGMARTGCSLPAYQQRTDVLGHLCRMVLQLDGPNLVHWTPSNMLVTPERFPDQNSMTCPNVLSIHPILFGGETVPGFAEVTAGFYTLGAADLVGREIHVVPAPVPWIEQLASVVTFVEIATMENGYIIPDDDTWGPEGDEFSYRIRHFEAGTPGTPYQDAHFRLTLERDDRHGWTAPDYAPTVPLEGGLTAQIATMDPNDPADRALIDRWAERERMSAGIGGRFNVSRRTDTGNVTGALIEKSPPPSIVPPHSAMMADFDADRPLNPNDPMDAAILARLAEREREASGAAAPAATETPAPVPVANRGRSSFGRRKGGFETRH